MRNRVTVLLAAALLATLVPMSSARADVVEGPILKNDVPLRVKVVQGKTVAYRFQAVKGQHLSFTFTNPKFAAGEIGVQPGAYDPIGNWTGNYQNVGSGPTALDFYPSASGTWTLELTPEAGAPGTVTVTMIKDQTCKLVPKKAVKLTIGHLGQQAVCTFAAVKNQPVTFSATHSSWTFGGYAQLLAYDALGNYSGAYTNLGNGPITYTFTTYSTGKWSVVLRAQPDDETTGTAKISYAKGG